MTLSAWRVAAPQFSSTPQRMMSGEGAYVYGGRWSSAGVRVVYLGSSLAQAALELLVHLGRADVLRSFCKMEVCFDETLVQHIALEDLPDDWREETMFSSLQVIGDQWIAEGSSLVLQVPSAAVAGEYNYLLNPMHPDMNKVRLGDVTRFEYDARLLK